MTRWVWGYLYWGVGWLLLGFLVAELLAYFGIAPWPVLTDTTRHAIKTYPHEFVGPIIFATSVFLVVHMIYNKAVWWSIMFALAVAALAFLMDKRL